MSVTVIVVNWNGAHDTIACLHSLAVAGWNVTFKVIVIDNGSTDDSLELIHASFPNLQLIKTGVNLGFTGGYNLGASTPSGGDTDFLLFLNNDTVVDAHFLEPLVSVLEADKSIGVASPVIHYASASKSIMREEAWFAGAKLDLPHGNAVQFNTNVPDIRTSAMEVDWVPGCAMLMRRKIVQELGGFDEEFFILWEDLDLCLRLKQRGLKCVLVPASRIAHRVSRSLSKAGSVTTYYYVRNMLRVIWRHQPRLSGRFLGSLLFLGRVTNEHLRRIWQGKEHGIASLAMLLRGAIHAAFGRMGRL